MFNIHLVERFLIRIGESDGQHRRNGNDKRTHTQAPVDCKLQHWRLAHRIQSPRHRTTHALEGFVRPHKDGGHRGRVRLSAHQPVAERLPEGIVHAIEDVEEHGPNGDAAISEVDILLLALRHATIVPELKRVSSTPDRHPRDE